MKIQDILFVAILLLLLIIHKRQFFVFAGLGCYSLAILFFVNWIFFTAERLTWYGSFFILLSLIVPNLQRNTVK